MFESEVSLAESAWSESRLDMKYENERKVEENKSRVKVLKYVCF